MAQRDSEDLRKQLDATRTELLRAEIRIEFRELVAQSIDELADMLNDLSADAAVAREKVSVLERDIKDLRRRMTKQENSILNQISNILFGWLTKGDK